MILSFKKNKLIFVVGICSLILIGCTKKIDAAQAAIDVARVDVKSDKWILENEPEIHECFEKYQNDMNSGFPMVDYSDNCKLWVSAMIKLQDEKRDERRRKQLEKAMKMFEPTR